MLLNKFEPKKETNKIIPKNTIKASNFNAKKELFEKKENKIPLKQNFIIKKNSNILNNPKFSNLAKKMVDKITSPQMMQKTYSMKNEPLNIVSKKENPNELIMRKPIKTLKKKPVKNVFAERVKQFEN